MHMFEHVSCLLPRMVDVERLIKYTLVFYNAKAAMDRFAVKDLADYTDRQMSLYPLVTHARQVLLAELAKQNKVDIGEVVVKDQVRRQCFLSNHDI